MGAPKTSLDRQIEKLNFLKELKETLNAREEFQFSSLKTTSLVSEHSLVDNVYYRERISVVLSPKNYQPKMVWTLENNNRNPSHFDYGWYTFSQNIREFLTVEELINFLLSKSKTGLIPRTVRYKIIVPEFTLEITSSKVKKELSQQISNHVNEKIRDPNFQNHIRFEPISQ